MREDWVEAITDDNIQLCESHGQGSPYRKKIPRIKEIVIHTITSYLSTTLLSLIEHVL